MAGKKTWTAKADLIIKEWGNKLTDKDLVEKLKEETGKDYSLEALKKHRQRINVFKAQGSALYKAPKETE